MLMGRANGPGTSTGRNDLPTAAPATRVVNHAANHLLALAWQLVSPAPARVRLPAPFVGWSHEGKRGWPSPPPLRGCGSWVQGHVCRMHVRVARLRHATKSAGQNWSVVWAPLDAAA